MAGEVLLLIAGAVIGFVFERVVNFTSQFYARTRPGRRLWSLGEELPTTIIFTGSRLGDESESVEGMAYPAEARAASEVESYLHRIYPGMRITCRVSSTRTESVHGNIVLVGGPLHESNTMTRELIGSAESPYWDVAHFEGTDGRDLHLAGRVLTGSPPSVEGSADVGLVLSVDRVGGGRLVVLAGCYTYGCLAAARSMVRGDVISTLKFVKKITGSRLGQGLPPFAMAVEATTSPHDVVGRPTLLVATTATRGASVDREIPAGSGCPGPHECPLVSRT
jgi:hypothetical protein